jgi:hypothetical protein
MIPVRQVVAESEKPALFSSIFWVHHIVTFPSGHFFYISRPSGRGGVRRVRSVFLYLLSSSHRDLPIRTRFPHFPSVRWWPSPKSLRLSRPCRPPLSVLGSPRFVGILSGHFTYISRPSGRGRVRRVRRPAGHAGRVAAHGRAHPAPRPLRPVREPPPGRQDCRYRACRRARAPHQHSRDRVREETGPAEQVRSRIFRLFVFFPRLRSGKW